MMKVSLAINFLLILCIGAAYANNREDDANNDSSSLPLLRGKKGDSNIEIERSHRNLAELSIKDPGDIDCELHSSGDGTLICLFRTSNSIYDDAVATTEGGGGEAPNKFPSTDLSCLNDDQKGYQFCVNAGINIFPNPFAGGVPPPAAESDVVPPPPDAVSTPATPAEDDQSSSSVSVPSVSVPSKVEVSVNYGGECPPAANTPNNGEDCSSAIPFGKSSTSCVYGRLQCDCDLLNFETYFGWNCRFVGGSAGGSSGATNIDATLNSVPVPSPTEEPVTIPSRSDTFVVNVSGSPSCPVAKPVAGSSCELDPGNWVRCPYQDNLSSTGYVSCDCTIVTGSDGNPDDDFGKWLCNDWKYSSSF